MANYLITQVEKDGLLDLRKYKRTVDYIVDTTASGTTYPTQLELDFLNSNVYVYVKGYFKVKNLSNCTDGFKVILSTWDVPNAPDSNVPIPLTYYVHTDPSTDVITNKISNVINSYETISVDMTAVTYVTIKFEGIVKIQASKTLIGGISVVTSGQTVTISEGMIMAEPVSSLY